MSKSIVETTGSFELIEPYQAVPYNRPAVVEQTHFLTVREGLGQIRVLVVGLDDAATDAEFARYIKDSENVTLAIAAFAEKYKGDVRETGEAEVGADTPVLVPADKKAAAKASTKAAEGKPEGDA